MNELKNIIIEQYQKYPLMQMNDFIKLFYQNCFGPLHLASEDGLSHIIENINHELVDAIDYPNTNQIEYIGNDYYRVSLFVVKDGIMTVKDLAERFYQSIIHSPSIEDDNIELFTKSLEIVRYDIIEGIIHLNLEDVDQMIDAYMYEGIRPVHHSDIYRKHYHPHYRVIHQQFLKDYIGV